MNKWNTLLETTVHDMSFHGYKPEDIEYIGTELYSCNWERFKQIANKLEDPIEDLTIVFKNGDKFIRAERKFGYGEGWELIKEFKIPKNSQRITSLFILKV